MQKLVGIVVAILMAGPASTKAVERQDFEAAKQQYERSTHDEAARLAYVTRLAQIADTLVTAYRASGERNDELMGVINSELQKHPVPKDVDSKKLKQLLVGKWDSPRHTYVFRADGKCGNEEGAVDGKWRIKGNQLIEGDSSGTIILLNHDYFIYSGGHDAVFFHSRVKDSGAEARTGTKNVATPPNIQAAQSESSFNNSEVTPESIAQAFVQAYSETDVAAVAVLYADRVDHTNSGVISNAAVRAQAEKYFARWPVRQWSLVGPVKTISLGGTKQKVIFSVSYDASDPRTNKHASGIAKETLVVDSDASGAMKIVSQKEQTSKRGSSQPSEETAISGPGKIWSEVSPDKKLLATIRFVPDPDQNCRACDDLKITVFRGGGDGKPEQMLASTAIDGRFLQRAHWSPDSQFLLFTTSLSRGAHGGWHYATFVYCAGDHSFRGDLEDVFGNVLAPDFGFESPDIAVLTVADDQAPSTPGEDWPSKQVKVSLGKVVDKLDRLP